MYKLATVNAVALISFLLMFAPTSTLAATQLNEFHADAKMAYLDKVPVDKAYGYMNVFTDDEGNGLINVMFYNANQAEEADFNARVKFLDQAGSVIKEERFNCWIDSAGIEDPIECKISKFVTLSEFDSIKVDFFLREDSE